jgi:peptide chain release factor 2
VLEINAGAGGTESCDWASMLLRMYVMWAEKHGFKVTEVDRTDGDVAGIKSVSLEIDGEFVYGFFERRKRGASSGAYLSVRFQR